MFADCIRLPAVPSAILRPWGSGCGLPFMQHPKLQTLFTRLAKTGAARQAGGQLTRWNFDGITDFVHPFPHADLVNASLVWVVKTVDIDSYWNVHNVLFCG
jgi:hypothetical protein